MALLEFHDVHKSFGAVRALRGVSFRVEAGEAHAWSAKTAPGKSTLLKILAGITRPDRGEVQLAGRAAATSASPARRSRAGIGMVFQERLAFPNLTVAANIFAGREVTRPCGRLDEAAMRARTRALLDDLHLSIPRTCGWSTSRPRTHSSCRSRARWRSTAGCSCSTSRRPR